MFTLAWRHTHVRKLTFSRNVWNADIVDDHVKSPQNGHVALVKTYVECCRVEKQIVVNKESSAPRWPMAFRHTKLFSILVKMTDEHNERCMMCPGLLQGVARALDHQPVTEVDWYLVGGQDGANCQRA